MGAENSAPVIRKDVSGTAQQEQQKQDQRIKEFSYRLAGYDISFADAVTQSCKAIYKISMKIQSLRDVNLETNKESMDLFRDEFTGFLENLNVVEGVLRCRGKNKIFYLNWQEVDKDLLCWLYMYVTASSEYNRLNLKEIQKHTSPDFYNYMYFMDRKITEKAKYLVELVDQTINLSESAKNLSNVNSLKAILDSVGNLVPTVLKEMAKTQFQPYSNFFSFPFQFHDPEAFVKVFGSDLISLLKAVLQARNTSGIVMSISDVAILPSTDRKSLIVSFKLNARKKGFEVEQSKISQAPTVVAQSKRSQSNSSLNPKPPERPPPPPPPPASTQPGTAPIAPPRSRNSKTATAAASSHIYCLSCGLQCK